MAEFQGEIRIDWIDTETGVYESFRDTIKEPSSVKIAGSWVKLFTRAGKLLPKDEQFSRFSRLTEYLEYGTNRLVVSQSGKVNLAIKPKDMGKILSVSKATIIRFLSYCKENNVIARMDKDHQFWGYVVNPTCAFRGVAADYAVCKFFYEVDKDFIKYLEPTSQKNLRSIRRLEKMNIRAPTKYENRVNSNLVE